MFRKIRHYSKTSLCAALLLLMIPGLGRGQGTKPLKVNWSSNSAAYLALWMAQEQGYFEHEGLSRAVRPYSFHLAGPAGRGRR